MSFRAGAQPVREAPDMPETGIEMTLAFVE